MMLDIQTGRVATETVDIHNNEIEVLPESRTQLKDFRAPCMDQAIALVKEAALRVPKVRYIGWDVCINQDYRPCLLECNTFPGQDATQNINANMGTYDAYKKLLR